MAENDLASTLENKVLIIDDNFDFVEATRHILRAEGCTVISSSNGKEGLALYEREKPYVVILDRIMEGLHGDQVLAQIRDAHGTDRRPPYVIVVTGLYDYHDFQHLLMNGADEYLTKPIDQKELTDKVLDFLTR